LVQAVYTESLSAKTTVMGARLFLQLTVDKTP